MLLATQLQLEEEARLLWGCLGLRWGIIHVYLASRVDPLRVGKKTEIFPQRDHGIGEN